ncbi:MAG TPA: sulfotransferase [Streptosporangiaceae bacterium]|nr:sulfotransferase [Streptosporangiaceae bacterium]
MVDTSSAPPAVKRAAQTLSVAAGRLTSPARVQPGFLITGGQRCGTTSMYRALSAHPAVLKPVLHKGVHYFDTGYDHGPAWYRAHFPTRAAAWRVERRVGVRPLAFESAPYYLCHPLAAERIARDLPDVRLIILLRDPVERAYSAHAHELARGFETETSFERALELEPERLAGEVDKIITDPSYNSHSHQHHAYVERGHYVEYLERLEKIFGRARLHVVDSHEFFADPGPVYDGVIDFLGLPHLGHLAFKRHNARERAPLSAALRARLTDHFEPYDARLGEWLGRPPSWRT